jgi:hypothetical protein
MRHGLTQLVLAGASLFLFNASFPKDKPYPVVKDAPKSEQFTMPVLLSQPSKPEAAPQTERSSPSDRLPQQEDADSSH